MGTTDCLCDLNDKDRYRIEKPLPGGRQPVEKPGLTKPNWRVTTSEMMQMGVIPQVTLGGACGIVCSSGIIRNTGRDLLGETLSLKGISFFEVQIAPSTHGREYNWELDAPNEKKARQLSVVRVYEIRPDTLAGVTHEEIMDDHANGRRSIVWFHGEGFSPIGLGSSKALKENKAVKALVGELYFDQLLAFVKAGEQMRVELELMLKDSQWITFVHGDEDVVEAEIVKALAETRSASPCESGDLGYYGI